VDWSPDETRAQLLAFTKRLVALRRDHPVFRRRRFFKGAAAEGGISDIGDIEWFSRAGTPMRDSDWHDGNTKSVAVFLNGERIVEPDKRGQQVLDDSFLVIFNAHHQEREFTVPPAEYGSWWSVLLDTADDGTWASDSGDTFGPGDVVAVSPRSTLVLKRPLEPDAASALTAAATQDVNTPSVARASRRANGGGAGEGGGSAAGRSSLPTPRPVRRGDDEAGPA
jgi:isoamylase